ncbi:uncharacterized protein LOC124449417 isoform X1 [Xenia sp. Carnegie-2017]|uniref:uncharacterized protein LOC124449417 isoform X1 n=1 Tax=Xenia sp. Carnegie-2017 TaxID=2897299 RepID=UPI001F04D31B|nr:uncharacterized protein LOC124449417 isoform X1 [Xenia sp. Carnegie-2017]
MADEEKQKNDHSSETNLNDPTNVSGNEFMLQSRSQQSQNHVYEEPRWEPENHSSVVKISFEPRPPGYEEPIIITFDKSLQNQSVDQCENSSVRDSMTNEDNSERYTSLILSPGCRNDLENNDYQPLLKNGNVTNGESVDQYQNSFVSDLMIDEDNGVEYLTIIE